MEYLNTIGILTVETETSKGLTYMLRLNAKIDFYKIVEEIKALEMQTVSSK